MTIQSRFSTTIPMTSIQTWVFSSCSDPQDEEKAWIDAERPETHFVTFAESRLLAKRIAIGLSRQGLEPGERVLVVSPNTIFFPCIVFGIWMAGGIFTGASPASTVRELRYQLRDSKASMVFTARECLNAALRAATSAGIPSSRIYVSDADMPDVTSVRKLPEGMRHWADIIASREDGHDFLWSEPSDSAATTCTINYSSGTTGLPKGAEISHYNQVANATGLVFLNKLHPDYEERSRRSAALCFLPLHHAFSQGFFLCSFAHERVPIYVMPDFELVKMLSHVETHRITRLMAVPPVYVAMTMHPLCRQFNLSSLEMLGSGAAPLMADTQHRLNELVPSNTVALRQGWGMTELTCTALAWDPTQNFGHSVGELMPDCQARLVHTVSGEEIKEAMVPGELWIAGPGVMRGYWRNPRATLEAFVVDADGTKWLRTGDVAYVEEYGPGGLFHIVDRSKELIKVKGYQVAPAELEALLIERQDVADAAVIGINVGAEEVPRAYVVRVPGSTVSQEEIYTWLAERVMRHKYLRGGVVFVKEIPRNQVRCVCPCEKYDDGS